MASVQQLLTSAPDATALSALAGLQEPLRALHSGLDALSLTPTTPSDLEVDAIRARATELHSATGVARDAAGADATRSDTVRLGVRAGGPALVLVAPNVARPSQPSLCSGAGSGTVVDIRTHQRRWTGIEPAGRGAPVPAALKAVGPTRRPDTSTADPNCLLAVGRSSRRADGPRVACRSGLVPSPG